MATIFSRRYYSKEHHHKPPSKKPNIDGRCKKHPKHSQSPGVCSLCLREKLAQVAANMNPGSRTRLTNSATAVGSSGSSSSSSLSSYYSSDASSCSSPLQCRYYRYNNTNNNIGRGGKGFSSSKSTNLLMLSGNIVLKKSRSLANFVPRSSTRSGANKDLSCDHDQKRKSGFWSKLLIHQGNNNNNNHNNKTTKGHQDSFMQHSRTVRERVH